LLAIITYIEEVLRIRSKDLFLKIEKYIWWKAKKELKWNYSKNDCTIKRKNITYNTTKWKIKVISIKLTIHDSPLLIAGF
jgi:hypothetical protein